MKHRPRLLQIGEKLPKQLLVEGSNDFHTLCNLFEQHKLPEIFGIKEKGGYDRIRDTLDNEIKVSGLQALGIIVDADVDLEARWQSLYNCLKTLGYTNLPKKPDTKGTIASPVENPELPIIGIWIMPNNQLPGILENFIAFLIPNRESNPSWQYAVQCVAGIPDHQKAFPDVRLPKAQLHTWLAWQEEPGKPIGQAISACYFDASSDEADNFINWLKRLFQLHPESPT